MSKRNSLTHRAMSPIQELEFLLNRMCISKSVINEVQKINRKIIIGGKSETKEHSFISDKYGITHNTHIPHTTLIIRGGTYLIYYHYNFNRPSRKPYPIAIDLTPEANILAVVEILKELFHI